MKTKHKAAPWKEWALDYRVLIIVTLAHITLLMLLMIDTPPHFLVRLAYPMMIVMLLIVITRYWLTCLHGLIYQPHTGVK